MKSTNELREKLIQAGYVFLRLCDTEFTNPEITHYTLEKSKEVEESGCSDNLLIGLETDSGMQILQQFLNPIVIHPNPLDI